MGKSWFPQQWIQYWQVNCFFSITLHPPKNPKVSWFWSGGSYQHLEPMGRKKVMDWTYAFGMVPYSNVKIGSSFTGFGGDERNEHHGHGISICEWWCNIKWWNLSPFWPWIVFRNPPTADQTLHSRYRGWKKWLKIHPMKCTNKKQYIRCNV